VSQEAIAAIRTRAELARRLAQETKQAEAKAALREIASKLDAEADDLEAAGKRGAS
jgi:C4-dicarboxylate-specific signal transduction histidine kinase